VPKHEKEIIQDDSVDNKVEKVETVNLEETEVSEANEVNEVTAKHNSKSDKKLNNELKKAQKLIEEKDGQILELKDRMIRFAADFDNLKKRTQKELENKTVDVKAEMLTSILPIIDNFNRALTATEGTEEIDVANLKQGVDMIFNQFIGFMSNQGVEEIDALGSKFDPELHNAVMHIDDESVSDNEIVEVFAKGYKFKDKVLRYSMVKVAN